MYGSDAAKPGADPIHAAFRREIARKPRQEKHQRRVAAELPDRRAQDLPLAEQRTHGGPAQHESAASAAEPAAGGDVVELRLVGAAAFVRLAVERVPDDRIDDADAAEDEEQRSPTERRDDVRQQRDHEAESDVLADGVDAIRPSALGLREPRRQDAAVGRETRRFRDAEREPRGEQPHYARHEPVQHRRERPEAERQPVGQTRAEPVEHEAAGNLRERIGPRERREDQPHQLGADRELTHERRLSDAHDGAIDVVEHRRERDEREDAEARARRRHFRASAACRWSKCCTASS